MPVIPVLGSQTQVDFWVWEDEEEEDTEQEEEEEEKKQEEDKVCKIFPIKS